MIGWIILAVIGGLTVIIAVLMMCFIKADIEYKGDFTVKARYLFITLYPRPEKSKKKKKSAKPAKLAKQKKQSKPAKQKKQSKTSVASEVKSQVGTLADDLKQANKRSIDWEMSKILLVSSFTPIKRFVRKLRVERVRINCVIGGDDAAKVALTYGLQSAVISSFLAWLKETVRLKTDEVNITADFMREETVQHIRFRVRVRVATVVGALIKFAIDVAKKKAKKKSKK